MNADERKWIRVYLRSLAADKRMAACFIAREIARTNFLEGVLSSTRIPLHSPPLQPLVLARRLLVMHFAAEPVARRGGDVQQGCAVAGQEFFHAAHFTHVLFDPDHLLAGAQAHVHFAVDAAGMLWARLEILLATAYLKQIQELILEQLGRRARAKRSVVNPAAAREPRGHLRAREFVR